MSKTNPGGTILNNEPLQEDERRELNNNDIVQVCGRRFLFTCGAPRTTSPQNARNSTLSSSTYRTARPNLTLSPSPRPRRARAGAERRVAAAGAARR